MNGDVGAMIGDGVHGASVYIMQRNGPRRQARLAIVWEVEVST